MVNKVTKLFCMTDDYRKFFNNFSMYKEIGWLLLFLLPYFII